MVMIKGIPLDSPLYEFDSERGIEYWGCKGLAAYFTIDGDVGDLLPAGLRPSADPALGAVLLLDYGMSTLGPYREEVSVIQVVDAKGQIGLYVPYIYVTNDAALAAGREVLGAPKKLADIRIATENDVVQATLDRPAGKRLMTLTVKPSARLARELAEAMVPPGTPMYSLRQVSPVTGETELVKWLCDIRFQTDARGEELIFSGPASLTYDSPSAVDPVHRLGVDMMIAASYFEFDMSLHAGTEEEIEALCARVAARV